MSTPTINSGRPSNRSIRGNSYTPCIPCDRSAASSASSMQLDDPLRDEGRACASANPEGADSMQPRRPQQQQSAPTNVGELVAKAKKAAASLWMILHAQNCRLCNDNCPHRGCSETKLLLAHVKSCPAGPGFPCPTQCKGCNETRKLLAHYRRCKDIRMKQVGLGRRSGLQPDSSCLVCSLMARYAKNMMDRSCKGSSQGKNNVASLLSSSADGKFNVERGMANFANQSPPSPDEGPRRTLSGYLMPPPPPRSRSALSSSAFNSCSSNESFFVSQPTPSRQKMLSKTIICNPSLLGKSVDSNVKVPFPALKRRAIEVQPENEELVVPGPIIASCIQRQRAGSYDEHRTRVKFAPTVIASTKYYFDEQGEEQSEQSMNKVRPRSASCSNMTCNDSDAMPPSGHECETIAEEGVDREQSIFTMD